MKQQKLTLSRLETQKKVRKAIQEQNRENKLKRKAEDNTTPKQEPVVV